MEHISNLPNDLQNLIWNIYISEHATIDHKLALNVKPKKIKMDYFEQTIAPYVQQPVKIFPFGQYYEIALGTKYLRGCYPHMNKYITYITKID